MSAVLQATHLVKHFATPGSRKKPERAIKAVNDVSLQIKEGTCFGLLGPNGAGKTTTVEMLEGIVSPTSGEILYRGHPLGEGFRERVGIMFQHTAIQDYITVREAIVLFKSFYRESVPIEQLIQQCALEEFLTQDTRKLSGGQKQRLLLAIALVNDPDVVFLDEPTTGLDPQARRNFWQLVNRIKGRGKTVILTTHYMEEASLLCDELVFMDHGKIIAQGVPQELLSDRFNDVVLALPLSNWQVRRTDNCALQPPTAQEAVVKQDVVEISTPDIDATLRWLQASKTPLTGLEVRSRSLEDLFIELTGQELRA